MHRILKQHNHAAVFVNLRAFLLMLTSCTYKSRHNVLPKKIYLLHIHCNERYQRHRHRCRYGKEQHVGYDCFLVLFIKVLVFVYIKLHLYEHAKYLEWDAGLTKFIKCIGKLLMETTELSDKRHAKCALDQMEDLIHENDLLLMLLERGKF
uniref:Uncharacterized protein n=1 Tax=Glossina brevipalpis TaxID=37001 RepID=A0A1A9WM64_9MUSC